MSSEPRASGLIRSALICHREEPLHLEGVARWLASWSDLEAIVVVDERKSRRLRRFRRELERVGRLRMLDVLAFRVYYELALSRADERWRTRELERLRRRYPPLPPSVRTIVGESPNDRGVAAILAGCELDLVFGLSKQIIAERVFTIPKYGTFVAHPGITPEYRNAHGCFWALAENDHERVGLTLLRIDRGVDTGPVFGYFDYDYDEANESHIVIQHRVLLENLDAIAVRLQDVVAGRAHPITTAGRESREWGQPWLTRYLAWKQRARSATNAADRSRVS